MGELRNAGKRHLRWCTETQLASAENLRKRVAASAASARRSRASMSSRYVHGEPAALDLLMQPLSADDLVGAEVTRALGHYETITSRAFLQQMRTMLVFALTTHPDARLLLRHPSVGSLERRDGTPIHRSPGGAGSRSAGDTVLRHGARESHGWAIADLLGVGVASDDEQAELVRQGIALVRRLSSAARRNWAHLLRIDDLICAGTMGLFDAARRFRRIGGPRFSIFARYRITGSIMGAMAEQAGLAERRFLLAWTKAFDYLISDFNLGGTAIGCRHSASRLAAFSDGLLSVMASEAVRLDGRHRTQR